MPGPCTVGVDDGVEPALPARGPNEAQEGWSQQPARSQTCGEAVQQQSRGCRYGVQPEACLLSVGSARMRALRVAHHPEAFEHVATVGSGQGRNSGEMLDRIPVLTLAQRVAIAFAYATAPWG